MVQNNTTTPPQNAVDQVLKLRGKAKTEGLTEGEESQMRQLAGAPQKATPEEVEALIAKCDAHLAAPMRTTTAIHNYLNGR